MITIRNTQLFHELHKTPTWATLWNDDNETKVPIPTLRGGLDHITVTKKYVTFHDVGSNLGDNTFRIGPEQETIAIYALPTTSTGLSSEIGNCDPEDTIVEPVSLADPLHDGCTRYITEDGACYDMNITPSEWEDWFGRPIEEQQ